MKLGKPTKQQVDNLKEGDRIYFIYLGQVVDGPVIEVGIKTVRVKINFAKKELIVKVFKDTINSIK